MCWWSASWSFECLLPETLDGVREVVRAGDAKRAELVDLVRSQLGREIAEERGVDMDDPAEYARAFDRTRMCPAVLRAVALDHAAMLHLADLERVDAVLHVDELLPDPKGD